MKKLTSLTICFLSFLAAIACPVCDRNKKTALDKLSHGATADGTWDYIIVGAITLIALVTLFLSIKWLIKPNEDNKDHIKYLFIN
jgi:hypothetical protein